MNRSIFRTYTFSSNAPIDANTPFQIDTTSAVGSHASFICNNGASGYDISYIIILNIFTNKT